MEEMEYMKDSGSLHTSIPPYLHTYPTITTST